MSDPSALLRKMAVLANDKETFTALTEAADLIDALVEAQIGAAASLAAAISLLERGGKKAAPSDKMFAVMLDDYRKSLDGARAVLARAKGEPK